MKSTILSSASSAISLGTCRAALRILFWATAAAPARSIYTLRQTTSILTRKPLQTFFTVIVVNLHNQNAQR